MSVTGWQGFYARNVTGAGTTNPEFYGVYQTERWRQLSQEIRLVSPSGRRFEWIAGAYGDLSTYNVDYAVQYNLFGGSIRGLGHALFDQRAGTFSAYATGTLKATDVLRLVGGVRWTYIRKHGVFDTVQESGTPFGYVPGNRQNQTFDERHFDPSLTLEYDVMPDAMVYASWSRGSKGGAFQAANRTVTAAAFALDPEEAEGFEVGLKSQIGGLLTFNIAAFQLTFRDQQTGQYVGTPPALINVNVGNRARAASNGRWNCIPHPGLSIGTVGTYLDAKYLDYPGAPCTFAQLQVGCVNGSVNAAGRELAAASKWSGNIHLDYDRLIGRALRFFLSSDVQYRSRANIDANGQNPFLATKEDSRSQRPHWHRRC